MGVKALTKPPVELPSVKSRTTNHPNAMLVEQPSPPAVQQIAAAPENAAPALTNPASVPEAAQNSAPPNQSPETPALTLTNPATETNAMQNVVPPNQDATGKQDAAQQSTLHTQPAQPQIAAKPEQANPSNAAPRTRSGDASSRSASSGQTGSKSSGAGHSTGRSSAASNAPPPAARTTSRPPPAPKPAAAPKRQGNPFGEGVPGG